MQCRCGYAGDAAEHPCHAKAYTCKKPAKLRFYNPRIAIVAGSQQKIQVNDTYACDDCWKRFTEVNNA